MKAVLQPIEQSVPDLERFTNQLKKRLECLKLSQQNFKCTLDMIIQIGVLTNREFPKECHVFCSQDKDLSEFIKKVNFRCHYKTLLKRKKEITWKRVTFLNSTYNYVLWYSLEVPHSWFQIKKFIRVEIFMSVKL